MSGTKWWALDGGPPGGAWLCAAMLVGAAVFPAPFASAQISAYTGTLSCRVELINDFVGDVSCVDPSVEPLRQYDLTVIRVGSNYIGRIPCRTLTCEANERVIFHVRQEEVPPMGQIFDCAQHQAMVWDCFMMLTETTANSASTMTPQPVLFVPRMASP